MKRGVRERCEEVLGAAERAGSRACKDPRLQRVQGAQLQQHDHDLAMSSRNIIELLITCQPYAAQLTGFYVLYAQTPRGFAWVRLYKAKHKHKQGVGPGRAARGAAEPEWMSRHIRDAV